MWYLLRQGYRIYTLCRSRSASPRDQCRSSGYGRDVYGSRPYDRWASDRRQSDHFSFLLPPDPIFLDSSFRIPSYLLPSNLPFFGRKWCHILAMINAILFHQKNHSMFDPIQWVKHINCCKKYFYPQWLFCLIWLLRRKFGHLSHHFQRSLSLSSQSSNHHICHSSWGEKK